LTSAAPDECRPIAGTRIWWAELRWIAQHEAVHHLDDLLLRRTRLGLVLPRGGQALLAQMRTLIQATLGWSDVQWDQECLRYQALIDRCYSLPASMKKGMP